MNCYEISQMLVPRQQKNKQETEASTMRIYTIGWTKAARKITGEEVVLTFKPYYTLYKVLNSSKITSWPSYTTRLMHEKWSRWKHTSTAPHTFTLFLIFPEMRTRSTKKKGKIWNMQNNMVLSTYHRPIRDQGKRKVHDTYL